MSDLLQAASAALGTPADLVQRSAAARAAANGTTVDDILAAWSGGAPAPAPAPSIQADTEAAATPTVEEDEPGTVPAVVATAPAPLTSRPAPSEAMAPSEPEVILEPVPLATRVRTAVRVGAWTGSALGVVGFLAATAFWSANTTVLPEGGPVVEVSPTRVTLGIALVSVIFGAIVAGVSRAATAWTNPAMELSAPRATTAWLGGGLGLILGVVAGAMLNGLATAVEGADPPLVQLPVLTTLFVMVIGGAVLGAGTAWIPQFLGVPVAVDDSDEAEVEIVRRRLGHAMSIPMAGLLILGVLVLPFAYALIQSNHLAPGIGGAVVAIIAAGGILGFASLAGTKPEMKISIGDVTVAVVGIGVVLVIIISVLSSNRAEEHAEEPGETGAIVLQI